MGKSIYLLACLIIYILFYWRKPSLPNITWKPVAEKFYFLNITGPSDIKLDIKVDFTSEKFWQNLGLLENKNLFPDKAKTEL